MGTPKSTSQLTQLNKDLIKFPKSAPITAAEANEVIQALIDSMFNKADGGVLLVNGLTQTLGSAANRAPSEKAVSDALKKVAGAAKDWVAGPKGYGTSWLYDGSVWLWIGEDQGDSQNPPDLLNANWLRVGVTPAERQSIQALDSPVVVSSGGARTGFSRLHLAAQNSAFDYGIVTLQTDTETWPAEAVGSSYKTAQFLDGNGCLLTVEGDMPLAEVTQDFSYIQRNPTATERQGRLLATTFSTIRSLDLSGVTVVPAGRTVVLEDVRNADSLKFEGPGTVVLRGSTPDPRTKNPTYLGGFDPATQIVDERGGGGGDTGGPYLPLAGNTAQTPQGPIFFSATSAIAQSGQTLVIGSGGRTYQFASDGLTIADPSANRAVRLSPGSDNGLLVNGNPIGSGGGSGSQVTPLRFPSTGTAAGGETTFTVPAGVTYAFLASNLQPGNAANGVGFTLSGTTLTLDVALQAGEYLFGPGFGGSIEVVTGGSGGGIDFANPITLSGPATLQGNKAYRVTGSGYALTLPDPAANMGKAIFIGIAKTATGLYPVGSLLSMYAGETVNLRATADGWQETGGKPLALEARIETSLSQQDSIPTSTAYKVPLSVVVSQSLAGMADTANSRLVIPRAGAGDINAFVAIKNATVGGSYVAYLEVKDANGSNARYPVQQTVAADRTGLGFLALSCKFAFAAGDTVALFFYNEDAASLRGDKPGSQCSLSYTESGSRPPDLSSL